MDITSLTAAWEHVSDYWPHIIAGGSVVAALARGIALAYVRRPKSTPSEVGPFFTGRHLLSPPLTRPAYSDRMAYILAEMSDLAYYRFEGQSGVVDAAVQEALSLNLANGADVREFLDQFSTALMSGRHLSKKFLEDILGNSGFSLLEVIDVAETQGFVCKKIALGEPYLVLAFRGTEKKVSDWLTDANCVPTVEGKTKVHTGFLEAFTKKEDATGRTVKQVVKEILDRQGRKGRRRQAATRSSSRAIRWAAPWPYWRPDS